MSSPAAAGVWAGIGSILGLFVGSLVGGALTGGRTPQTGKGAAGLVLPALAGTALGAFAGAALSANSSTTSAGAGTAGLPAGVGRSPTPAMKPADANLSRYDGRYQKAGVEPPHKCTAKSANAIAQQLPGAPWNYAGNVSTVDGMRESSAQVTTPMGAKTIPYWTDNKLPDGGYNRGRMPMRLVLQCPYTGERWQWFRSLAA